MEYPRMVRQLKEVIERAYQGNHRVRQMDIEAIKDALDQFDETIPDGKPLIGFQIPKGNQ